MRPAIWLLPLVLIGCEPPRAQTAFGTTAAPTGGATTSTSSQPTATNPTGTSARVQLPRRTNLRQGVLEGVLYFIKEGDDTLNLSAYTPRGSVYTNQLNIATRTFTEGFPGITERLEWFAVDYAGVCRVEQSGEYRFRLLSDDGARLYVNDQPVIENDGVHAAYAKTGSLRLEAGVHSLRVPYFQGPRDEIALQLWATPPGGSETIFVCKP